MNIHHKQDERKKKRNAMSTAYYSSQFTFYKYHDIKTFRDSFTIKQKDLYGVKNNLVLLCTEVIGIIKWTNEEQKEWHQIQKYCIM